MRRSKRTIKAPTIFDPTPDNVDLKEIEEQVINDEQPVKNNPWNVSNFEAFLFYDCPECNHKCQDRTTFAKHAILKHKHSNDLVQRMVQDGSVKIDLQAFQKISEKTMEKSKVVEAKKPKLKPESETVQCYVCGFEQCEKVQIIEHIQEQHFPEVKVSMYGIPREFQCQDCRIMFSTPGALGLHLCGVLPPRWSGDYLGAKKCQDCNKSFKKRYGLFMNLLPNIFKLLQLINVVHELNEHSLEHLFYLYPFCS